jgi:hypothetical protein
MTPPLSPNCINLCRRTDEATRDLLTADVNYANLDHNVVKTTSSSRIPFIDISSLGLHALFSWHFS